LRLRGDLEGREEKTYNGKLWLDTQSVKDSEACNDRWDSNHFNASVIWVLRSSSYESINTRTEAILEDIGRERDFPIINGGIQSTIKTIKQPNSTAMIT
jgi:hypothetical protein